MCVCRIFLSYLHMFIDIYIYIAIYIILILILNSIFIGIDAV